MKRRLVIYGECIEGGATIISTTLNNSELLEILCEVERKFDNNITEPLVETAHQLFPDREFIYLVSSNENDAVFNLAIAAKPIARNYDWNFYEV